MAFYYRATQRMKEAQQVCQEAHNILLPILAELHGDDLARNYLRRAQLDAASKDKLKACDLARQALAAAYDPALKQAAQTLIDQLCPSLAPA